MKKVSTVFIGIIILLIGCSDDNPTNPGANVNEKALKITFSNNYCEAEGWVIVYTEDGLTVIDTAKFLGNATVDFGELAQDRITLTFITTTLSSSNKSYMIQTYHSVKKGEWKIKGYSESAAKGKIDVRYSFPLNNYNLFLMSYGGTYNDAGLNNDTLSSLHFPTFDVYNINSDNSLSLYSSIYNMNDGIGFYNWSPKLSFTLNDTNTYNIAVNKPLTLSQIQFNKEVENLIISANTTASSDRVTLFHNYDSQPLTTQKIFLPDDINATSYNIYASNYYNSKLYTYEKSVNSLPNNLVIPNTVVSATHNNSNNSIENISVNGTIDFIMAIWSLFNSNNRDFIWISYTPNDYTSIVRPQLPTSIVSQIGNFNPDLMNLYYLMIEENDKFTSFDDLINYYYKSTVPLSNTFNEHYSYAIVF
jgi:hypothetical protein